MGGVLVALGTWLGNTAETWPVLRRYLDLEALLDTEDDIPVKGTGGTRSAQPELEKRIPAIRKVLPCDTPGWSPCHRRPSFHAVLREVPA